MVVPEKESRFNRVLNYGIVAAIFIGVLVFTLSNGGGSFSHFAFGDHSIILTNSQGEATTVRYDEMTYIELIEKPSYGAPVSGSTINGIREGLWESDMFGQYISSTEERIPNCILIRTDDTAYVFNCEAESTTRELYDTISTRMVEDQR